MVLETNEPLKTTVSIVQDGLTVPVAFHLNKKPVRVQNHFNHSHPSRVSLPAAPSIIHQFQGLGRPLCGEACASVIPSLGSVLPASRPII